MSRYRWHDADDVRATPTKIADDLPLFAAPSVAVDTSERAADSIRHTIKTAHAVILGLLTVRDTCTCEEIRGQTGWSGDYARPRLVELEGMQLIEKCDGKQGRPLVSRATSTGRQALAYRLTSTGRRRVEDAA